MKIVSGTSPSAASVLAACLVAFVSVTPAAAQPEGGPPPGGPPHRPFHPDPIRRALDADGDHVISSEEIEKAATALKALDKNGDGKLDREELRPSMPPGMEHRRGPPPGGERPENRDASRGPERAGGPWQGMLSPDQIVERMMEFDADKDGKLDRSELNAAAERMTEKMAERRREFMDRMGKRSRELERGDP